MGWWMSARYDRLGSGECSWEGQDEVGLCAPFHFLDYVTLTHSAMP